MRACKHTCKPILYFALYLVQLPHAIHFYQFVSITLFFINQVRGRRFKIDRGPVDMKYEAQDMSIASPILRWGKIAVGGEPPIPAELVSIYN